MDRQKFMYRLAAVAAVTAVSNLLFAQPLLVQADPRPGAQTKQTSPPLPARIESYADLLTSLAWLDREYRTAPDRAVLRSSLKRVAELIASIKDVEPKSKEPSFNSNSEAYKSWHKWANAPAAAHTCGRDGSPASNAPCSKCGAELSDWFESTDAGKQVLGALDPTGPRPGAVLSRLTDATDASQTSGNGDLSAVAAATLIGYACRSDVEPEYCADLVEQTASRLEPLAYHEFRDLVLHELMLVTLRECLRSGYETGDDQAWSRLVTAAKRCTTPTASFGPLALGIQRAASKRAGNEPSLVWYAIQQLVGYAPLTREQQRTPIQALALGSNWNPATSVDEGFFRLACPRIPGDNGQQHLQRIRDAASSCNETASRIYGDQAIRREFSGQLAVLAGRVLRLETDVAALKQRVAALEERMSAVEAEIGHLWDALRETNEFVIEYTNFRRDQRQYLPAQLTDSDLSLDQQTRLLRRLAPVFLTDNPCSHGKATPGRPCATCGETVLSAQWMVENCGLLRPPPGPATQFFNFENGCAEAPAAFFVGAVRPPQPLKKYAEWANEHDAVSMCQGSPHRNGPAGSKFASLTGAIDRGDGVYGLVQKVGTTMYSVQYYVLFAYNSARIEEIDAPFFYQRWNHGGDWLCIDLTVRLMGRDVDHPIIVLAYMHNHGPVIEVSPSALEMRGTHPMVYLEYGCNEPEPRAGTAGDRHTYVPGIRRNHRIKDTGWGQLNEVIERIAVRTHLGRGPEYATEKAVRNLANAQDTECAFVTKFAGDWGKDGDSPKSPYFNPQMRTRGFEFPE